MVEALICGHSLGHIVRDFGPALGIVGVGFTLLINGGRDERQRRREVHARALEAVALYYEMPFLIRRRRDDEPAAERARLSERFADVQAELASCEALIRADNDAAVRAKYATLVGALRAHAGKQASLAWDTAPITQDSQMAMGDVYLALQPVRESLISCETVMAKSTTPRHRRLGRR